ncbi:MAG: ATP-binding protein [Eubacterium sp.]|nr:ATP-binding protein [Eubacterium sp.]
MAQNPYSLIFGKEPAQLISRAGQTAEITNAFRSEPPTHQIFMITGVRGSGKTVLMTEVTKQLKKDHDWIVIELNPDRDMLVSLASKLSSENAFAALFQKSNINLSFFGLGLEVNNTAPITDIETALSKMLKALQRHGKKILVTVDEAVSTPAMREFASAFQILIRQDLPLFLLMTGLYDNINKLQNEKTLTFLYRAPKIEIRPLNIGTIAANYKRNFHLNDPEALDMAKKTRGYSFAFQVLGYFTWEHGVLNEEVLADYKLYLEEYVYEKIWSELSENDRKLAYGIASAPSGQISEIRDFLNIETNQFNPYRKRLIKKGLLNGDTHGYVFFTLPLFNQFVLENYGLYE